MLPHRISHANHTSILRPGRVPLGMLLVVAWVLLGVRRVEPLFALVLRLKGTRVSIVQGSFTAELVLGFSQSHFCCYLVNVG